MKAGTPGSIPRLEARVAGGKWTASNSGEQLLFLWQGGYGQVMSIAWSHGIGSWEGAETAC